MGRLSWRWTVPAVLALALGALPSLAGALPASSSQADAATLLARVRGSASVGWSGLGESRGSLVLPDVQELADLPALLGGTQRTRTWWQGEQRWRVDALTLVGETDTSRDPDGSWRWSSADRLATRTPGASTVHLPAAPDLVAPVLGRRLAGAAQAAAVRLGSRRVAGRSASGVRLTAVRRASTTIESVELWIEPATGLVLEAVVRAGGAVVLDSLLLDLQVAAPSAAHLAFEPPEDVLSVRTPSLDLVAQANRFAPFVLPPMLAGMSRTAQDGPLAAVRGVATYGAGLGLFAVVPLPRRTAGGIIASLLPGRPGADQAGVRTAALNGLVGRTAGHPDGRGYLLVGTVPAAVLVQALAELVADPPPRVVVP